MGWENGNQRSERRERRGKGRGEASRVARRDSTINLIRSLHPINVNSGVELSAHTLKMSLYALSKRIVKGEELTYKASLVYRTLRKRGVNMYKISFEGRQSSHEGSNGYLLYRQARMGEDMGLANLLAYQARGFESVMTGHILYEDGCSLGPFLFGVKSLGQNRKVFGFGELMIKALEGEFVHVSHDGSTWTVTLS